MVDALAYSSIAAAGGAVVLGVWGEVRARRRGGARGRWAGMVLGCAALAPWAWLALRR